jgi:hypothetical protein
VTFLSLVCLRTLLLVNAKRHLLRDVKISTLNL